MIRIFTRQIEKLGTEDGQALVFVALVGLVTFLFFAMTMNVAELVNTKIKNQNVADATALSAAVWQARALNLISATNRNMVELYAGLVATTPACVGVTGICTVVMCGEVWTEPLFCLMCLLGAIATCQAAASFLFASPVSADFQDRVLNSLDKDLVYEDLEQVVDWNYAFKENTRDDDVGFYVHYPFAGDELLGVFGPGDLDTGESALERSGLCEIFLATGLYLNYLTKFYGLPPGSGLTDDDWNAIVPTIDSWYSPGPEGHCYHDNFFGQDDLDAAVPGAPPIFPIALRTRNSSWNPQALDPLLAVTVATYKAQEPPTALGKGEGPADCTWESGHTEFACPNVRHYAFASAHAYSASVSNYYNAQVAAFDSPHLPTYIPFVMDWQPRLFPVQQQGFDDILDQIEDAGFPGDSSVLARNVLQIGGADFFLY
jgi:hypothetical protein